VSEALRERGWQVPAYTMPADATDVAVLRIVVREGMSVDLADSLLDALGAAVEHLTRFPPDHEAPTSFSHT
jgi:glutamate decarboxylase